MSSSVTLSDIRTRVRERGEFLDPYFTDASLNRLINDGVAAFWDFVITLDSEWETIASTTNITVVPGTKAYSLPSNFYVLKGVDLVDQSTVTGRITMESFQHQERNDAPLTAAADKYCARWRLKAGKLEFMPTPTWSGTVELLYIPTAPNLSSDSSTIDSRNLWTEWIILYCLIHCGIKEEQSVSGWVRLQKETEVRISSIRRHNQASPKTVVDVYTNRHYSGRYPYGR